MSRKVTYNFCIRSVTRKITVLTTFSTYVCASIVYIQNLNIRGGSSFTAILTYAILYLHGANLALF